MSKQIIMKMPHVSPDAEVTVEYIDPTVGQLRKLMGCKDVIELLVKHCEVLLTVDGKPQPPDWWNNLPETVFEQMVKFMESNRPIRNPQEKSVLNEIPLVSRR